MHNKKLKICLIFLGFMILGGVGWLVKTAYDTIHDPVWNYDVSSMKAGSKIVRFEKCGENKFCGFNDYYNVKNAEIFYENGKITRIERYSAGRETGELAWSVELPTEQKGSDQNPEVLKILRFFNSKEGKRMLQ